MSQRDGFSSGFLLGTIVGGVVGGVVGALLTARQLNVEPEDALDRETTNPLKPKPERKKKAIKPGKGADMEAARRSLEDKIAQLNEAIDDVRQQLGGVNEAPSEDIQPQANPSDFRS